MRPAVVELKLAERDLYDRIRMRASRLDNAKISDGFEGKAWSDYRELEGVPYRFPKEWTTITLDASRQLSETVDASQAFFERFFLAGGLLGLLVGDAGAGKSTVMEQLVRRRISASPVLIDWIKDPIKILAGSDQWPSLRRIGYAQIYHQVAQLISWGQPVLLEGTFKIEMHRCHAEWSKLIELITGGAATLDVIGAFVDEHSSERK
jgi:hypothetical protein